MHIPGQTRAQRDSKKLELGGPPNYIVANGDMCQDREICRKRRPSSSVFTVLIRMSLGLAQTSE